MPSLKVAGRPSVAFALLGFVIIVSSVGCRRKISAQQCDELVDRFAQLVVTERFPDAGPDVVARERSREKQEAKATDELKNCASQVQASEHACAMRAETSEAMIKCLE